MLVPRILPLLNSADERTKQHPTASPTCARLGPCSCSSHESGCTPQIRAVYYTNGSSRILDPIESIPIRHLHSDIDPKKFFENVISACLLKRLQLCEICSCSIWV